MSTMFKESDMVRVVGFKYTIKEEKVSCPQMMIDDITLFEPIPIISVYVPGKLGYVKVKTKLWTWTISEKDVQPENYKELFEDGCEVEPASKDFLYTHDINLFIPETMDNWYKKGGPFIVLDTSPKRNTFSIENGNGESWWFSIFDFNPKKKGMTMSKKFKEGDKIRVVGLKYTIKEKEVTCPTTMVKIFNSLEPMTIHKDHCPGYSGYVQIKPKKYAWTISEKDVQPENYKELFEDGCEVELKDKRLLYTHGSCYVSEMEEWMEEGGPFIVNHKGTVETNRYIKNGKGSGWYFSMFDFNPKEKVNTMFKKGDKIIWCGGATDSSVTQRKHQWNSDMDLVYKKVMTVKDCSHSYAMHVKENSWDWSKEDFKLVSTSEKYSLNSSISCVLLEKEGACNDELVKFIAFALEGDYSLDEEIPLADAIEYAKKCEGGITFLLNEGFIEKTKKPERKMKVRVSSGVLGKDTIKIDLVYADTGTRVDGSSIFNVNKDKSIRRVGFVSHSLGLTLDEYSKVVVK